MPFDKLGKNQDFVSKYALPAREICITLFTQKYAGV